MFTTDFAKWLVEDQQRMFNRSLAPRTVQSKVSRLTTGFLASGTASLEEFAVALTDRGMCEDLLDALSASLAPSSVAMVVVALRDFSRYAQSLGWTTRDGALTTKDASRRSPQRPVVVYQEEEIALLLAGARVRDFRFWCFLMTLTYTGRRVDEVLGLTWEGLHLNSKVPYWDLPHTKGRKQNLVPLGPRLVNEVFTEANVEVLKQGYGKQWTRSQKAHPFPWSYDAVHARMKTLCGALNVPYREGRPFHTFRHSYATSLLAQGVPMHAVSSLLGHSSVVVTDRVYNHTTALSYAHFLT